MKKLSEKSPALSPNTEMETTSPTAKQICFPSPAKLNLFLYINGKRADGYHELQSLFQLLDYGDQLTISSRTDGQILLSPALENVKTEDNLIYRAAKLLQQKTNCRQGANIQLEKVLPMGAGIGGGSSNAATTLVALNYLWQTQLNLEQLAELGLSLGADVPIFVLGNTAFAEGVGEKLTPCEVAEKWYLVLKPEVDFVSTAKIFADPNLPRNTPKRPLAELLTQPFSNDCEKVVLNHYPAIEQLHQWLLQYAPTRLTGTGACLFAEFETEQAAQCVFQLRPQNVTGFVAKGVNHSPLHQLLAHLQTS